MKDQIGHLLHLNVHNLWKLGDCTEKTVKKRDTYNTLAKQAFEDRKRHSLQTTRFRNH